MSTIESIQELKPSYQFPNTLETEVDIEVKFLNKEEWFKVKAVKGDLRLLGVTWD